MGVPVPGPDPDRRVKEREGELREPDVTRGRQSGLRWDSGDLKKTSISVFADSHSHWWVEGGVVVVAHPSRRSRSVLHWSPLLPDRGRPLQIPEGNG